MKEITEAIGKIRALCRRSIADGEFTFDEHNAELAVYCAVLREDPNFDTWAPLLFEVVEEFDGQVDLTVGSPGPLVHALESQDSEHRQFLLDSLVRKPTHIGVWMADRFSRSPGQDKEFWEKRMKDVLAHPKTSDVLRNDLEMDFGDLAE